MDEFEQFLTLASEFQNKNAVNVLIFNCIFKRKGIWFDLGVFTFYGNWFPPGRPQSILENCTSDKVQLKSFGISNFSKDWSTVLFS